MIHYKIRELFNKSGKSYRELSGDLGLAYRTIYKLAHAKTQEDYEVGTATIDKLCSYFKIQPGDILTYKKK